MNRSNPAEGRGSRASRATVPAPDDRPSRELVKASELYEEYVELSRLGDLTPNVAEEPHPEKWVDPVPAMRPLGLTFGRDSTLGLSIRTGR